MAAWIFTLLLIASSTYGGPLIPKTSLPTTKTSGKALLNKWYEVITEGKKTGYFNEKIVHDEKNDLLIYSSLTHRMEEEIPVEQVVESISRFKDLVPIQYTFKEKRSGSEKIIQGEVKAGTLYVPALDKTFVLPIGTYFSGLFSIVIHRQMPLKEKASYNLNLFYEDVHEYKTSIIKLIKKLPQNKYGVLAIVDDLQFEMILGESGAILHTMHGPLMINEVPYSKTRENWEHSSKFKAPVP